MKFLVQFIQIYNLKRQTQRQAEATENFTYVHKW